MIPDDTHLQARNTSLTSPKEKKRKKGRIKISVSVSRLCVHEYRENLRVKAVIKEKQQLTS